MLSNFCQLAVVALTLGLCGCKATSLKQTWKAPDYAGGPVQKIAVLAVDERDLYREAVEGHFTYQIKQQGQNVFATHVWLSLPAIKADKEAAAAQLRERGADTLLLVRLASQTTSAHQSQAAPARYAATITGYENLDWYGYYSVAFMDMGTVWSNTEMEVCLETSVFDLKTGQRLWCGITQTVLKEETDRLEELSVIVTKVVAALRKDGLIR